MFDIGFFELLVIAVIGLVVIGPERLPAAIRSGALWWGRIKRNIRETRAELEQQLGADEIRRELHNEEVMRSLESLRETRQELEREVQNLDQAEAHIEPSREAPPSSDAEKSITTSETAPTSPPPPSDAENPGSKHD